MGSITQESQGGVMIPRVGGVNQRMRFTNPNAVEFDELVGFIQQRAGVMGRIPGTRQLANIPGVKIMNFCQTFDKRRNVLVQTDKGIYRYHEHELMGRVFPTNLNRNVLTEQETMAKAIIIHSTALGTGGGNYGTAAVWQVAPLSSIISQNGADGLPLVTPFVSLAGNVFTLTAGAYRINGWSIHSSGTAGGRVLTRLRNTSLPANAWAGLPNETSPTLNSPDNYNIPIPFGGDLLLGGSTNFQLENFCSHTSTNGFGFPRSVGAQEVYRWVEIYKLT